MASSFALIIGLLLLSLHLPSTDAFARSTFNSDWRHLSFRVTASATNRAVSLAAAAPEGSSDLDSHGSSMTAPPYTANSNISRRTAAASVALSTAAAVLSGVSPASAKCTDIESCREIGEKKVEADMKANPTTSLSSGVRYKVLRPPTGGKGEEVTDGSTVDLIFSITEAAGAYMYSRGFGFEKIDIGGKKQSDLGVDSLRVVIGRKDLPVGIEQALTGMRRGERRRIELPPNVGFETSDWKPEPNTRRGKTSIVGYRRILEGNGTNQPPFPAVTIWDVEVLSIRN